MTLIKYDEVQVGDSIRATTKFPEGTSVVVTGVVKQATASSIKSDDIVTFALWDHTTSEDIRVDIELLHRAEPQDHIIVGTRGDGKKFVTSTNIYTKTEAFKVAKELTEENNWGHTYQAQGLVFS